MQRSTEQLAKRMSRLKADLVRTAAEVARVDAALNERIAAEDRVKQPPAAVECKRGYVNIKQSESDKRWNLWIECRNLKFLESIAEVYEPQSGGHLPTSVAWFVANVVDEAGVQFSQREVARWFTRYCTCPVDGKQDRRIRGALQREIRRLHDAGYPFKMSDPKPKL